MSAQQTDLQRQAEREEVLERARRAKEVAPQLAALSTPVKNAALNGAAEDLVRRADEILEANARDIEAGRESGLAESVLDLSLIHI